MKPSRHGGPYRVGVLGGGQLGRMLALAAAPLGIRVIALDPGGASSPTGQVSPGTLAGSFTDPAAIRELAAMVDVLTVEIEHVDATALSNAAAAAGIPAHPSPATITLIQDKYLQKEAMAKRGVPLGKFKGVGSEEELLAAVKVRTLCPCGIWGVGRSL
jgi:phosphoribosylaminoimidazole carboxylase (NCAIR synthetase)